MLFPNSLGDVVHRVAFWILLALFGSTFIRFMLMIDSNKRVYNHTPGPCRAIHNLNNGSAGMEYIKEENLTFVTFGLGRAYNLSVPCGIAIFRILPENSKFEVEKLKIEGSEFNRKEFAPHGISAYYSKGKTTLYVVNKLTQCIEIFQYQKEKKSLLYRKSVCSPHFTRCNIHV
ncbi:hypothetical protein WR25_15406 [Diploscapter pachys]|uniref:Uncharacterized protein n=1 Tax=Diploscapter pachys TaxID=2018661 RepID=A0A2A2LN18_9BILA|nr:hypothetical protein WR25_15406 [Diploscapter pachys]